MNKREQRLVWDLAWFMTILLMIFGSYSNETVRAIAFVFAGLVGLVYGASFTEFGPFTQLPPGRYLAVKRGLNIIKYYLNQTGWGVAADGKSFIPDPEGDYLMGLKTGFLGFFFNYFGMVWTGFPVIGGVRGSMVTERKVKFSQKEDGTLKYWTDDIGPAYYTAPPFMRHYGFVLGSIASKGNNTWNFAIPSRILVINPNDYDHRLTTSPDNPVKGSFESALRPLIKKLSTDNLLNIRSENKNDPESIAAKAKEIANANLMSERLDGYGYGVMLHDVDFQVVEPAEANFAEAIRMEEIEDEIGKARLKKADWEKKAKLKKNEGDVEVIRTQGKATAKAQELYVKATGDNAAAWLAKGMGDVREGVTIVLGDGVLKNIPIGGGNRRDDRKTNNRNN